MQCICLSLPGMVLLCKCRPFQQLLMDQGVLQLAASFLDPCHGAHVNLPASVLLEGLAALPGSGHMALECEAVQVSTRTLWTPSLPGKVEDELACISVWLDWVRWPRAHAAYVTQTATAPGM